MSEHHARIDWKRGDDAFIDRRYSRRHRWTFEGGMVIDASASPAVVPAPLSDPRCIDPEQAFVASLASCHMLWFLAIAAERGWCVDAYADAATGSLSADADGCIAITEVVLRPRVRIADATPSIEQFREAHAAAHAKCFLARSVRSRIVIDADFDGDRADG